jgi:hypothetical protein
LEKMSQTRYLQDVEEIPYPPPPWDMKGQFWMGSFKSDVPVPLPTGLKHLLDPHSLTVVLLHFSEGTLCYDELAFGTLARLGWRVGLYVDYIWVNHLASLWGGRRVWGLPKNMAEFTWKDAGLSVTDDRGPVVTFKLDMSPANLPRVGMPMPMITQLEDGSWLYSPVSLSWRGRVGGASISIEEWPERFDYHPSNKPFFSFSGKPFHMVAHAGKAVSRP